MLIVNVIAKMHNLLNETILFNYINKSLLVLLPLLALSLLPNQIAFSMNPNWSWRFSPQS
jgi:ATP/ADP translocase